MKTPFVEELGRWFAARAPREQAILRAAIVVVPLLVLYLAVWQPLTESRARLRRELPQLREAATRFAVQADEFERLSTRSRGRGPARSVRSAVESSAARHNVTLQGIDSTSTDRTVVQVGTVPFDALSRWLGEMGSNDGLMVESLQVTSAGDGQVKVDRLVLVPAMRRAAGASADEGRS